MIRAGVETLRYSKQKKINININCFIKKTIFILILIFIYLIINFIQINNRKNDY